MERGLEFAAITTILCVICHGCRLNSAEPGRPPNPIAIQDGPSKAIVPDTIEVGGMRFVRVPLGRRLIGTDDEESDLRERPPTWFHLDNEIFIGVTEVTNTDYFNVVGGEPPSQDDRLLPVATTWEKAVKWCQEAERKFAGLHDRQWHVRLPTEAEWEYVASFGHETSEDAWSDILQSLHETDWFALNSGGAPHPVGRLRPNALGIYDLFGNEKEWCDGILVESVTELFTRVSRPTVELKRPWRGGNYASPAQDCRLSIRRGWFGEYQQGFRVVIEAKRGGGGL